MKTRTLISLLLMAWLVPASIVSCNNVPVDNKGDNMEQKSTIPAIDADAPTNTETATFALG